MRLETPNLVLVPIQFTDANDIHQVIRENIAQLKDRFTWAEEPYTLRNAQVLVQEAVVNQKEGKAETFTIRTKTGRLEGMLTLKEELDACNRKVPMHHLIVWMRNHEQTGAYLAEGIRTATDHALRVLSSRRVFGLLDAAYPQLVDAYQQAGFQKEATLKNARGGPQTGDMVMMVCLPR